MRLFCLGGAAGTGFTVAGAMVSTCGEHTIYGVVGGHNPLQMVFYTLVNAALQQCLSEGQARTRINTSLGSARLEDMRVASRFGPAGRMAAAIAH